MHTPNLRIQDGAKIHLLCSNCENKISSWEKMFHKNIFLPLHDKTKQITSIRYGPWFLKFATSISFRVLTHYYRLHGLPHFLEKQRGIAQIASNTWRDFLLVKLTDPGQFEQHFIPVDAIQHYTGTSISPYLNRYLLRTIHMDIICSQTSAMVYTKMGHLILFGFIQNRSPKRWKGTKIHVNKGLITHRNYQIPQSIAEYWNEKANESHRALDSISSKQKKRIQQSILNNADKLVDSEVFRAIQFDVYHSGRRAFSAPDLENDNTTTKSHK